jgi:hypothetical protein
MEKPKIFIASSSRALTLADCLRRGLAEGDGCEVEVWNAQSASQLGKTIIEMLEQAAKGYDFAVIILTRDDVVFRKGGKAAKEQARDNCIFEAGLFFGSLGRDRCFLVASIEPKAVPVDLTGIIHVRIKEPEKEKLGDVGQCQKAIADATLEIKQAVQQRGKAPWYIGKTFQLISHEELFNREKHESEGGHLEEDQVVVSARQPFEEKKDFPFQVMKNLKNGIKYVFFFHASEDGAQKICKILQMILLAGVIKDPHQLKAASFAERWDKIKEYQDKILQKLKEIRNNENLKICFLPFETPLQFSIHNANSESKARAYLKWEKNFIHLLEGDEAYQLAKWLQKVSGKEPPLGIFHSTILCDISSFKTAGDQPFSTCLDRELKRHFPDIHDQVKALCNP